MVWSIFCSTIAVESLAIISIVTSILFPRYRIWPPPRPRAWQGYALWLLFIFSGTGVIATGVLAGSGFPLYPWLRYSVGVPLWLAGNSLSLWGLLVLGLVTSMGGEGILIQHGPYRFSRNPQYLGFMISLVGWGILTSSVFAMAVSLLGIVPLILVPFVEESWLDLKYPEAYGEYKRAVPRFLGLKMDRNRA